MTTSSAAQSASVTYWGFEDAHLTLKQKSDFWSYKIGATWYGKRYEGTMLELAKRPELAKEIHQQYSLFCKNRLPTQKSEGKNDCQNFETGTGTPAVPAGTKNSPNAATTAPSAEPGKKSPTTTHDQSQRPSCTSTDTIFCVCTAFLSETDDTYCEDCWAFFTVSATAFEFKRQNQLQPANSSASTQLQHTNTNAVHATTQGVTPVTAHSCSSQPSYTPTITAAKVVSPPNNILRLPPASSATHSPNKNTTAAHAAIPGAKPATVRTSSSQPCYAPPNTFAKTAAPSDEISLLTPPPSSSPTLATNTPQKNEVIDLISPVSTPANSTSPSKSVASSASPPKKKGREPWPRKRCKKCDREFPVNMKKNDGVRCTQCCRKEERAKELEVPVSAVVGLPQPMQPVGTSLPGASPKRKAEQIAGAGDTVDAPASKKMRMDSSGAAVDVVEEKVESAVPPADMSPRELLEYGFVSAWNL